MVALTQPASKHLMPCYHVLHIEILIVAAPVAVQTTLYIPTRSATVATGVIMYVRYKPAIEQVKLIIALRANSVSDRIKVHIIRKVHHIVTFECYSGITAL